MSTVRAPWPDTVLDIEGLSVISVSPSGEYSEYLDFYNRAGDLVAHIHAHNPEFYYVKALKRIGAYDVDYREVLIKDWYIPNIRNPLLTNPAGVIPITPLKIAWSPDGLYLVLGSAATGYLSIFKRSGDTYTSVVSLGEPSGTCTALAWSPDGRFLVSGTSGSPYIQLYSRTGSTFTRLTVSVTSVFPSPPDGSVVSLAFTPDSRYLAVGGGTSYLILYDRGSDPASTVFTRVPDLNVMQRPEAQAPGLAWSPDGNYLFAGTNLVSPSYSFNWYKREGSLLTKLPNPSIITTARTAAWSSNNKYLAIGSQESAKVYKRVGDTLVALPELQRPSGAHAFPGVEEVVWTPDGNYLMAGVSTGSGDVHCWKVNPDTDTFTLVKALANQAPALVKSLAVSPDGKHVAAGITTSPYLNLHKSAMGPIAGAATRIDKDYPTPG